MTASAVAVTNALFTVSVDFGTFQSLSLSQDFNYLTVYPVFYGNDGYLEISVRCPAGSGSYVTLTPRQQLTATPNATFARLAGRVKGFAADGSITFAGFGAGGTPDSADFGCPIPDPLPPQPCYFCNSPAVGPGQNTAIGALALNAQSFCTDGDNTAVGFHALANANGNNNIALGSHAGANLGYGINNIFIGNLGTAESNTIRIGDPLIHTGTHIAGISGATSPGGVAVYVDTNGKLGTVTSSARFKDDIQEIAEASSGLMKLRPVRFRYKRDIDPSGLEQYGLVAEDVAKVYPDLVVYDSQGRANSVRYHFLTPMLLNEVQKQSRQIAEQRELISAQARQITQLAEQARRVADQTRKIEALTARLTQIEAALDSAPRAEVVPVPCTDGRGL